jgi:RHS repeat-associated protein
MGNLLKHYAGMHFVYDARGNLIEKQSPAGEQRYEWDAFNRLKAATVKETSRQSEARYYYDPLGRRIAKEVNGERTVFGWDGDTLAYETKSDSGTHYVYEAGSFVPLAQFVTSSVTGIETPVWKPTDRYLPEEDPLQRVPQRTAEARVFYYHCDQIGTPLMMTDDVGDVVWEASYKAWGEARKVIERASKAAGITPRNPIRFQGQQHDDETGLAYNRHRYYDAASGRFVSQDPIGLHGGINVYAYARNSISWTDPLGLTSNESSPSTQAAGWQGKGNYPGVDAWSDAVLEKGTLVAHGAPGTSNFVTTVADVEASKGSRSAMFGSLQVAPHPERGFRPGMTVCELTADTAVTKSTVLANPQHGPGRAEQYFIPDEGLLNLKPLFSIPLTKQ